MGNKVELCEGCLYLERRWLGGMTWCSLSNRPCGKREVACHMKKKVPETEQKPAPR